MYVAHIKAFALIQVAFLHCFSYFWRSSWGPFNPTHCKANTIPHAFLSIYFFSTSFTICLSNILAVDIFSYAGLHDTEQIIFW